MRYVYSTTVSEPSGRLDMLGTRSACWRITSKLDRISAGQRSLDSADQTLRRLPMTTYPNSSLSFRSASRGQPLDRSRRSARGSALARSCERHQRYDCWNVGRAPCAGEPQRHPPGTSSTAAGPDELKRRTSICRSSRSLIKTSRNLQSPALSNASRLARQERHSYFARSGHFF